MPTRSASTELLATPHDVWVLLSEPYHLADWWPNVATVEPDRRGFSAGARWRIRSRKATWIRRAEADDTFLIHVTEPERRFTFELLRARLRAELLLTSVAPERSRADLTVSGPYLPGFSRTLARDALERLHDLVQTATDF